MKKNDNGKIIRQRFPWIFLEIDPIMAEKEASEFDLASSYCRGYSVEAIEIII